MKLSCKNSLLYLHYFIILSETNYWRHFLCTLREIHAIYRDLRLNWHFHIFVNIVFHQIITINYFKNVHNFIILATSLMCITAIVFSFLVVRSLKERSDLSSRCRVRMLVWLLAYRRLQNKIPISKISLNFKKFRNQNVFQDILSNFDFLLTITSYYFVSPKWIA